MWETNFFIVFTRKGWVSVRPKLRFLCFLYSSSDVTIQNVGRAKWGDCWTGRGDAGEVGNLKKWFFFISCD